MNDVRPDQPKLPREEAIRKKLEEAELYLRQGLFAEARQIYDTLLNYHQSRLVIFTDSNDRSAIETDIAALEAKVAEIRHREKIFEQNHRVAETAQEGPGDRSATQPVHAVLGKLEIVEAAEEAPHRAAGPLFSFNTICTYPKIFLVASLILAAVFAVFNPFVKTVNNVDYFRLEDDPDMDFYEQFKKIFGNDEFFVIAFETDPLFSKEKLTLLKSITQDLETIEDIESVTSLANVDDIIGEQDYFEVRPFLEEIPDDPDALASLRAQATHNYLYLDNLLPKDARTAAILVQAYDRPDDPDYRRRLLSETEAVLQKYRKDVPHFYLGGWTTTNLSLSQYLKADMIVFVPATYFLIALTTWLFFRNIRLTIAAVINISVCLAATRGLLGMTGVALNNVTSIVIPLVMALSLCDTVHIFSHLDRTILDSAADKYDALAKVLKRVALPCFLTTVTTAVGFFSLSFSHITPIKEFAWIASAGMVFEFVFSFFLLPPVLLWFRPEKIYHQARSGQKMDTFISQLGASVQRHYRAIAITGTAVILVSIWAATLIRVETNLIEFFKKESPVRTALDFVENRLSGVGTLDVSFKAQALDAFKQPSNLRVIERLQQYIDSLDPVDKTMSFVDFLKDMNASFHAEDIRYYRIPASPELVSQYLLVYDSDDIEDFINTDYDHARISVRISEHSSAGQKELIERIKAYIQTIDHQGIDIRVTGRAVTDANVIDALVQGQVSSLSMALGVISLIMLLVFRSFKLALLSMIPNLFPIVLNFGIMGMFNIPLDTGTALIAAVALGIAVDDTIHFLSEYQLRRSQNMTMPDALTAANETKGRAIVASSLILCIGFGVLGLSRFVPIIHFGLLSAIIMLTALIGDLVFLPTIMLLKPDKYRRASV